MDDAERFVDRSGDIRTGEVAANGGVGLLPEEGVLALQRIPGQPSRARCTP